MFILAGCDGLGMIATPGGTLWVTVNDGTDTSTLQVVVAFDDDRTLGDGSKKTFAFDMGGYRDLSGNISHAMTFDCPGVPEGDYFVYAWLDYDADGELDCWSEQSWLLGTGSPGYVIDASGVPTVISYDGSYPGFPVPNYFLTDRFAAPLDIALYTPSPS